MPTFFMSITNGVALLEKIVRLEDHKETEQAWSLLEKHRLERGSSVEVELYITTEKATGLYGLYHCTASGVFPYT